MGPESFASVVISFLIGFLVVLVFIVLGKLKRKPKNIVSNRTEAQDARPPSSKKSRQEQPCKLGRQPDTFAHPLLASSLKGHSGRVNCLDFSSNGKYLASCSDDGMIMIWSTKDFMDHDHRCLCVSVELDHAIVVRFSPDSRALIAWLANGETLRVFKMTKKDDGSFSFKAMPKDFPQRHKADVINIGIAETGKFIMTAFSDTTILIWDLAGEVLASIDTNQTTNSYSSLSPCGRFVACCGCTPDVKVWEVHFDSAGDFTEVVRAFDLKGHSADIQSFAFSNDSSRMVTLSKDGTWKLWDTTVEYRKQQEPCPLVMGTCRVSEGSRVALSPDARVVAVTSRCGVAMYSTDTGELEEEFHDVHSEEVTDVRFDINGRFLVCSGDCVVRVFHNTPGYRAAIRDMEAVLEKACDDGVRRRLRQQVQGARSALDGLRIMAAD